MSDYGGAESLSIDQRFGRRVRQARERSGRSQDDVARAMRDEHDVPWHQTTVAKVEAGSRPVKLAEAVALAEVLRTDLSTLAVASEPGEQHLRALFMDYRGAQVDEIKARERGDRALTVLLDAAREVPADQLRMMGSMGAKLLQLLGEDHTHSGTPESEPALMGTTAR